MNSKDYAIGILSTTAVILLVGIMVIHSRPDPAMATGMTVSGGGYVMTVGAISIGDEELLFVIDTQAGKMIAYRFDIRSHQVNVVQGFDLDSLDQGAAGSSKKKSKSKKRRP
ncbi:MAG: hypothetical protein JSU63_07815 [Phycisphaerales bacterium]|nr:MAG: hypothetical protein JSU63_07815 [Phycisphaerales bacterium]